MIEWPYQAHVKILSATVSRLVSVTSSKHGLDRMHLKFNSARVLFQRPKLNAVVLRNLYRNLSLRYIDCGMEAPLHFTQTAAKTLWP